MSLIQQQIPEIALSCKPAFCSTVPPNMPDDTPQLVVHPITGDEVLYAPLRARRANALIREQLVLPVSDFCPFCPGNEHETPPAIYRWPAASDTPWQLRVVPNRFPVIATIDKHLQPEAASNALGRHEVLIESANHDDDWSSLPTVHLAQVLFAVGERVREWSTDPRSQQIQVFKNVGTRAGATLAHPHMQLLSMNYLPLRIVDEMKALEQVGSPYHLPQLQDLMLIVEHNISWMTYCPPVSRVPYEMCIVPPEHKPFQHLSFDELLGLATHLQSTFHRLEAAVGKISHNVIWRLPPHYHDHIAWRIEILPRMTTFAGLELGTGLYVNPIRPEVAARHLATVSQPA